MALGSLLIQKQYNYSDRKRVEQITENPYYQYFIGLPGFSNQDPYVPLLLVEFRKRLDDEILAEINEMIIAYNTPDDPGPGSGGEMPQIAVERSFSLAKRCYGLGKIMTRLNITTRSSIALSVLAMNVDSLASLSLSQFLISLFSRYKQHEFMLIYMQNNRCEISAG